MRHAKAIFFDLGETLVTQNIEDNLVTRNALEKISKLLPQHKTVPELFRIYREGYKRNEAVRSRHFVEVSIEGWMVQFLRRATGKEPEQNLVEKAIKIIVSARAANAVIFPDSKQVLKRLAKRKVKLGIISNVSSHNVAVEILRKVGLLDYFDTVITSAFVGIRKPDPGIFFFALHQLKVTPSQAIHVGDSEKHDVWGASIAGLRSVLISKRKVINTIADYHFGSLGKASSTLARL